MNSMMLVQPINDSVISNMMSVDQTVHNIKANQFINSPAPQQIYSGQDNLASPVQQPKGENGESPHPLTDYKTESLLIGEGKNKAKPENT